MRQEYRSSKSVASRSCDWLLLVLPIGARGAPLTKTDGKSWISLFFPYERNTEQVRMPAAVGPFFWPSPFARTLIG